MHSAKWSDNKVQPQVYKVDVRVNLPVLVEMKCWNEVGRFISNFAMTSHLKVSRNTSHLRKQHTEESDILVKHFPMKAALTLPRLWSKCLMVYRQTGSSANGKYGAHTHSHTHTSRHKHTWRHNRPFLCFHFLKQQLDRVAVLTGSKN